jgi:RNA methyltransferase, TrmH family
VPALAASNHRIRRLRRLSGRRGARTDDHAFLLEGPVLVSEALAGDHGVEGVYVDDSAHDVEAIVELAERRGTPVHRVVQGVLGGITDTVTPRPVLAVVTTPTASMSEVIASAVSARRPLVVLVEVRDPGNVGTIVRAADASGVAGVICTVGTADPWSPKVVRSSAGSVLHVPIVTGVDASRVVGELHAADVPVYVSAANRGTPYHDAPLEGCVAFVLGNEAHGVPQELLASAGQPITIPMQGGAESLNVAVAASVLVFDALRQRRAHSDWTQTDGGDKVNTS